MLQPLYPCGKRRQYPLASRVGGTKDIVDVVENGKINLPLLGMNPSSSAILPITHHQTNLTIPAPNYLLITTKQIFFNVMVRAEQKHLK
jgi:hypothetical protein